MDLATLTGLIISIAAIMVGIVLSGGTITSYFQLASVIIVIAGTIGATMMSFPLKTTMNVFQKTLGKAFRRNKVNHKHTMDTIINFAQIARKEGLLAIEKRLEGVNDRFLKKGLQLAVDGVESNKIIEIMEADLQELEARHVKGISWFSTAGGYSPTFGIIGTVLGLIIALSKMDSPDQLGTAVAAAFLTTLYGIIIANLFFMPVAKKLRLNSEEELREKQLMLRGILGIQSGANPRLIKEELMVFVQTRSEKNKKIFKKKKAKKVEAKKKK